MKDRSKFILAVCLMVAATGGEVRGGQTETALPPGNSVLQPLYTERYEYYEVCGCTEKDLQCDLTLKAIKCSDGNKYDSVTNWKVKWDYDRHRTAATCSTKGFQVTVDVVFRLPKWVQDPKLPEPSPQLVDKWQKYVKNLEAHEMGHRDRAVEAAAELTRTIETLPPARTCSELDSKVNRISRARLSRLIADQEAYDVLTNHGHYQGVQFP